MCVHVSELEVSYGSESTATHFTRTALVASFAFPSAAIREAERERITTRPFALIQRSAHLPERKAAGARDWTPSPCGRTTRRGARRALIPQLAALRLSVLFCKLTVA
jgi:hypothetical protein